MDVQPKRRALVCAASTGLGFASAKQLLRQNRSVLLVSRSAEKLSAARARLLEEVPGADADDVAFHAADLSRAEDVARLWQGAIAGDRAIDIVVTNAGGPPPGGLFDLNDAQWRSTIDALLMSVVHLMRLALPPMRDRKWGRFVTITSSSCKEPIPGLLLSNVLRAGLAGLVHTVAAEEIRHGITINNVCPGLTDTERLAELFEVRGAKSGRTPEEERAFAKKTVPRGAFNHPDEFGAAVAFLCSEAASGVSGVSLSIDAASGKFIF